MRFDTTAFKSLTFFGKRSNAKRVANIQQRIDEEGAGLTRTGLAKKIAIALKWKNPNGSPKCAAGVLEKLEELGVLKLPRKRERERRCT
ncbi:MAG: hypothetical protein OXC63_03675 [Aestuariivita sp.]|nr:hypothetical protein [Aestuariivita sp.]MCY4346962.1 hypothetical protein [Aestuariivita sp.]